MLPAQNMKLVQFVQLQVSYFNDCENAIKHFFYLYYILNNKITMIADYDNLDHCILRRKSLVSTDSVCNNFVRQS